MCTHLFCTLDPYNESIHASAIRQQDHNLHKFKTLHFSLSLPLSCFFGFPPSFLSLFLSFLRIYPSFFLFLLPIFTFLPFPLPGLLSITLFLLLLFLNLFHELFLSLSEFCRRRQSVASIRRIGNTLYLTRVIGTHRKPRTFSMIYKLNKGASINDVTSHFGEKGCEIVHGINGASVNHVTILWKDCQVWYDMKWLKGSERGTKNMCDVICNWPVIIWTSFILKVVGRNNPFYQIILFLKINSIVR